MDYFQLKSITNIKINNFFCQKSEHLNYFNSNYEIKLILSLMTSYGSWKKPKITIQQKYNTIRYNLSLYRLENYAKSKVIKYSYI